MPDPKVQRIREDDMYIKVLRAEMEQMAEWQQDSGVRHSNDERLEQQCWSWRMLQSPAIWQQQHEFVFPESIAQDRTEQVARVCTQAD